MYYIIYKNTLQDDAEYSYYEQFSYHPSRYSS